MTKLRRLRAAEYGFILSLFISSYAGADNLSGAVNSEDAKTLLGQVDERLVDIDGLIEQLNKERAENRNSMRTLHMERFQARQQLQTDDEEIAALQQQVVDAEKQLYDLKLALNKKLAEQPAYQEASEAQEAMIQREGEIAREVTGLHDERVALQIERKRLQMELDAAGEPAAETENQPEQEAP